MGNRVRFEPFVGIAPRRYFDLFSWVPRKAADKDGVKDYSGDIATWSIGDAALRDSVADAESLQSGAKGMAIDCLEKRNIDAFRNRLKATEMTEKKLDKQLKTST